MPPTRRPSQPNALGPAISALALCGLLSYGCKKAEEPAPPAPTATPPHASPPAAQPAPAKPADTKPAEPTASTPKPTDAKPPEPKPADAAADAPPKKPAIPHTDLAQDAQPLRSFTTPTNVIVEEFKDGQGAPLLPGAMGATVTIHLVGRLKKDWKTIQDTYADGEPLVVPAPQLLPGLADGLTGMKVGGVRRLTIPPDRGFKNREPKNEKGEVVIPAGSTLVYDVELVAAKQSFAAPKPPPDPVPAPTTPDMNK